MRGRSRIAVAAALFSLISAVATAQSAAVGAWDMTTVSPEGNFTSQLVIREEGGTLVAVGKSERGERPYDSIEVKGSKITLVITITYNGSPMVITYTGTVDAKSMGGDADYGGLATGSWSAVPHKTR